MNTFCSGNWMEMCQVIAPAGCFWLFEQKGTGGVAARERGPPFPEQRQLRRGLRVVSRPLLSSGCKCLPTKWEALARCPLLSCVFPNAWRTQIFFFLPRSSALYLEVCKAGVGGRSGMHYWWVDNMFVVMNDICLIEKLNRELRRERRVTWSDSCSTVGEIQQHRDVISDALTTCFWPQNVYD